MDPFDPQSIFLHVDVSKIIFHEGIVPAAKLLERKPPFFFLQGGVLPSNTVGFPKEFPTHLSSGVGEFHRQRDDEKPNPAIPWITNRLGSIFPT